MDVRFGGEVIGRILGTYLLVKQNDYLCAKKLIRTCVNIAQLAGKRSCQRVLPLTFTRLLLSAENHKRQTTCSAVFRKEGISSLPQTCTVAHNEVVSATEYLHETLSICIEEAVELLSLENAHQKVSLISLRRWLASRVFTLQ